MQNFKKVSAMLTPVQIKKAKLIAAEMGVHSIALIVRWAIDFYFKHDPAAKKILKNYTESQMTKEGGQHGKSI
jgi:hypothetical protein